MNAKVWIRALAGGAILLTPGAAFPSVGSGRAEAGSRIVLAADTAGRGTGIGTEPRGGTETASPAGRAGTGRYEGTIPPGMMAPEGGKPGANKGEACGGEGSGAAASCAKGCESATGSGNCATEAPK